MCHYAIKSQDEASAKRENLNGCDGINKGILGEEWRWRG